MGALTSRLQLHPCFLCQSSHWLNEDDKCNKKINSILTAKYLFRYPATSNFPNFLRRDFLKPLLQEGGYPVILFPHPCFWHLYHPYVMGCNSHGILDMSQLILSFVNQTLHFQIHSVTVLQKFAFFFFFFGLFVFAEKSDEFLHSANMSRMAGHVC